MSLLSPGSQSISTSCITNHFSHYGSPLSCSRHYMNHMSIYPFPGVLIPLGTMGDTLYHRHIHLAILGILRSQWAKGAAIRKTYNSSYLHVFQVPSACLEPLYQCCLYPDVLSILGVEWALGATIWTICLSSHLWAVMVPSEPWEPICINDIYV